METHISEPSIYARRHYSLLSELSVVLRKKKSFKIIMALEFQDKVYFFPNVSLIQFAIKVISTSQNEFTHIH